MVDNKQKPQDGNLIDLARERQRLQQQRAQAAAKSKKLTRTSRHPDKPNQNVRWYHYVQLIVFLALLSYSMSKCQGA